MRYEGIFTNAFKKDLKAIGKKHPEDMKHIVHSIEHTILIEPFSGSIKRLQCFGYFRHRVGKYRIVFDIDANDNVFFYAVDHRSSIYDKLWHRFKKC